jgi:hypothetical protein
MSPVSRPITLPELNRRRLPGNCEKNMSASKPSNELKNQAAELNSSWQSIVQRGNRIIVIEEFFATTFSCFLSIKFSCEKSIQDH